MLEGHQKNPTHYRLRSWREREGSYVDVASQRAAAFDLIIAASAAVTQSLKDIAEQSLLHSRRPVLLAPSRLETKPHRSRDADRLGREPRMLARGHGSYPVAQARPVRSFGQCGQEGSKPVAPHRLTRCATCVATASEQQHKSFHLTCGQLGMRCSPPRQSRIWAYLLWVPIRTTDFAKCC